jgi:hypothetical protein
LTSKKGEWDVPYKGFSIQWTGWKTSYQSVELFAQWACLIPSGEMYYSTTNLQAVKACPNTQINPFPDYSSGNPIPSPITIFSSAAEKGKRKQAALAALIGFIDSMETHE